MAITHVSFAYLGNADTLTVPPPDPQHVQCACVAHYFQLAVVLYTECVCVEREREREREGEAVGRDGGREGEREWVSERYIAIE